MYIHIMTVDTINLVDQSNANSNRVRSIAKLTMFGSYLTLTLIAVPSEFLDVSLVAKSTGTSRNHL
jgi:hypothetical protein